MLSTLFPAVVVEVAAAVDFVADVAPLEGEEEEGVKHRIQNGLLLNIKMYQLQSKICASTIILTGELHFIALTR